MVVEFGSLFLEIIELVLEWIIYVSVTILLLNIAEVRETILPTLVVIDIPL